MRSLHKYIDEFRRGEHVAESECAQFLELLLAETDEALLRELFIVWETKGIADSELFGLACEMRRRCRPVATAHKVFVDAVGTGGSKAKTFNVSTAAAFVSAGAGVPVAKHGNRAATSNSGSADVLSALGMNILGDASQVQRCLDEIGICFMFAPHFHQLSPVLGRVRKGLGFPTIFNNLGPLCNPAGAPHQLIGVWSSEWVRQTAVALSKLGSQRSWVVHGSDGLDEITISGPTTVAEVLNGEVSEFEICPDDFGLRTQSVDHIRAKTSTESAALILGVLDNSIDGAARDLVVINAAATIHLSGNADSLPQAAAMAAESITTGAALQKLKQLAEATNG